MNKQKGFYTIEAIVAILVFSIGTLGVMKIQTNSIKAVSDAQYRANASFLADAIIGEMWLDSNNIGNYANKSAENYLMWEEQVRASMPGVTNNPPQITLTSTSSGDIINVTIFWKNPGIDTVSQYNTQTIIN